MPLLQELEEDLQKEKRKLEAYDRLAEDLEEAEPEAYLDLTLDDEKHYLDKYLSLMGLWPTPNHQELTPLDDTFQGRLLPGSYYNAWRLSLPLMRSEIRLQINTFIPRLCKAFQMFYKMLRFAIYLQRPSHVIY